MGLEVYHRKRDFGVTPEPKGRVHRAARKGLSFVIQKHRASHLHYDFRLELDGVLLSWAVPKGPSLDPADKRLAMQTEDHPIEYGEFEGVIPPKQYGAGTVLLWDRGTWVPDSDAREAYRKGRLKFRLDGEKLRGAWMLVRGWGDKDREGRSWFLIKIDDEFARQGDAARIVDAMPRSVASGRDLDEIAADPDRVWHSNRSVDENVRAGSVEKARRARVVRSEIPGARKARMPAMIAPQLATLAKSPPHGEGWVHEIKYDGYRMVCRVAAGAVQMISRNGKDWTAQFPSLARVLARLPVSEAWLDGEVVVMQDDGRTSFQALQNALGSGDEKNLVMWLFDVMYVEGQDLTAVPLEARKRVLKQLLEKAPATLRYSEHFEGSGDEVHAQACRLGLEGIVSKRRDAPYSSRRGKDWLKIKCALRQEFVIAGYTDPSGSRTGFGALLLGVHDAGGALRYCGKVGTGFNEALLSTLAPKLARLQQDKPAFVNPPRGYDAKGAHWIKPQLVAEIAFTEWTRDGTVRHPSFQGLRSDKKPRDVVLESPIDVDTVKGEATSGKAPAKRANAVRKSASGAASDESVAAGIAISNPDKVLYPEARYTKLELARYYETVGERMLPHLAGRPLTLVRCPNGWKHCFYQKHAKAGAPDALEQIEIRESTGIGVYMMANSVAAIVALLQMGVLEIHPWGATRAHLDRPDRLVFDFDPDEDLPWDRLVEAVGLLRTLLDNLGLRGFLKTTGGKGLHVVLPIRPDHPWDVARSFTKGVADLLVQASPTRFTSKVAKNRRGGKIFVDYLRNSEGATAVAPYSLRAKANAPVSMPIGWDELATDVRFDAFNVRSALERLRARRDPWREFSEAADQVVTSRMLAAVGLR